MARPKQPVRRIHVFLDESTIEQIRAMGHVVSDVARDAIAAYMPGLKPKAAPFDAGPTIETLKYGRGHDREYYPIAALDRIRRDLGFNWGELCIALGYNPSTHSGWKSAGRVAAGIYRKAEALKNTDTPT